MILSVNDTESDSVSTLRMTVSVQPQISYRFTNAVDNFPESCESSLVQDGIRMNASASLRWPGKVYEA